MTKKYPIALTIAGSDSGGGAGIQADLKAFSANGVYGMSALTALTAQNTQGVNDIHPVPVDFLEKQLRAVLDDIGADAIKIGMLHSSRVIQTVVRVLKDYHAGNIVVDPVMVATSGDKLLQDEAIKTLIEELLPIASVITPNIPEAEILLDHKIKGIEDLSRAARELSFTGSRSILVKSGHLDDDKLMDILYDTQKDTIKKFEFLKTDTKNTHGTGCTLSSAIAAHLALGEKLEQAVANGLTYTHEAIRNGAEYKLGKGHGPVHHFYKFW